MAMLNEATGSGTQKVSYPHHGEAKEIEVNFEELNRKETVRTGNTYPNLRSQAVYAIRDIENAKDRMLHNVSKLFSIEGEETIYTLLDSINDYLERTLKEADESGNPITREDFMHVMNRVYISMEEAKALLAIYVSESRVDKYVERLEYAQKGILL